MRIILYYLNCIALMISFGGLVYSVSMLLLHLQDYKKWLIALTIFLLLFALFLGFFIIRKSKLPLAGKDFY